MSDSFSSLRNKAHVGPKMPWWRVPIVWLVLAGPAGVVVAGLVTAWVAVSGADTLVTTDARAFSEKPAVQGRNHAATASQR